MDERAIKGLVKGWYVRARRERDPVSQFVFLWFCFNGWLAYESGRDADRAMINWLKSSSRGTELRSAYVTARGSTVFRGYLKTLASMSPITSPGRPDAKIASADDFRGIVEGIYRVRCNLFHGAKSPNDIRDQKLVKLCAALLVKWVGNLVGGWRAAA